MDDADKEIVDTARALANVIAKPAVGEASGQNRVVDALAIRMLWEEKPELDEVEELELLRLWNCYLWSKRVAELKVR